MKRTPKLFLKSLFALIITFPLIASSLHWQTEEVPPRSQDPFSSPSTHPPQVQQRAHAKTSPNKGLVIAGILTSFCVVAYCLNPQKNASNSLGMEHETPEKLVHQNTSEYAEDNEHLGALVGDDSAIVLPAGEPWRVAGGAEVRVGGPKRAVSAVETDVAEESRQTDDLERVAEEPKRPVRVVIDPIPSADGQVSEPTEKKGAEAGFAPPFVPEQKRVAEIEDPKPVAGDLEIEERLPALISSDDEKDDTSIGTKRYSFSTDLKKCQVREAIERISAELDTTEVVPKESDDFVVVTEEEARTTLLATLFNPTEAGGEHTEVDPDGYVIVDERFFEPSIETPEKQQEHPLTSAMALCEDEEQDETDGAFVEIDQSLEFSFENFLKDQENFKQQFFALKKSSELNEEERSQREATRTAYLAAISQLAHEIHAQKPIARGSYSIDDTKKLLFDYLHLYSTTFAENLDKLNPIAYSRDPEKLRSSHYKKSDTINGSNQHGIDVPTGTLPNGCRHLLYGRIKVTKDDITIEKTFIKCESYGIGTWQDFSLHALEFLHNSEGLEDSRREKDIPDGIKQAFKQATGQTDDPQNFHEIIGGLLKTEKYKAIKNSLEQKKAFFSLIQAILRLEGDLTTRTGNEVVLCLECTPGLPQALPRHKK